MASENIGQILIDFEVAPEVAGLRALMRDGRVRQGARVFTKLAERADTNDGPIVVDGTTTITDWPDHSVN